MDDSPCPRRLAQLRDHASRIRAHQLPACLLAAYFTIDEAWEALRRNLRHPGHRLAPLDFSFDYVLQACTAGIVGHRQITDGWLLTAAVRAGARLLTFDSGVATLLASNAERGAHITLMRSE